MKTLRARRQLAIGGRLDFETSITRRVAGARIIVTDLGSGIGNAAAIDRRMDVDVLGQSPVAFHHGPGRIDAVDDDGHARTAGNDDGKSVIG